MSVWTNALKLERPKLYIDVLNNAYTIHVSSKNAINEAKFKYGIVRVLLKIELIFYKVFQP